MILSLYIIIKLKTKLIQDKVEFNMMFTNHGNINIKYKIIH